MTMCVFLIIGVEPTNRTIIGQVQGRLAQWAIFNVNDNNVSKLETLQFSVNQNPVLNRSR